MEYGICNIGIIAVRRNPSEISEMVTQLIFGELYEIINISKEWIHIKLSFDSYEGWISANQMFSIKEDTFNILNKFPVNTTSGVTSELYDKNRNEKINIPLGSSLPHLNNNSISFDNMNFVLLGDINKTDTKISRDSIVETALLFQNAPYLWGGRTPFGIDCSGFTQMVYKINGIKLMRDASQQSTQGETISFISEAKAGDLAFFDNKEEEIIHVGIIIDNNKIIHASGKVRVDNIDHYGIFNKDTNKYSHKLRLLKTHESLSQ